MIRAAAAVELTPRPVRGVGVWGTAQARVVAEAISARIVAMVPA